MSRVLSGAVLLAAVAAAACRPGTPIVNTDPMKATTPGTIGTGASPSNLPGDDPTHPGFPGKVGR